MAGRKEKQYASLTPGVFHTVSQHRAADEAGRRAIQDNMTPAAYNALVKAQGAQDRDRASKAAVAAATQAQLQGQSSGEAFTNAAETAAPSIDAAAGTAPNVSPASAAPTAAPTLTASQQAQVEQGVAQSVRRTYVQHSVSGGVKAGSTEHHGNSIVVTRSKNNKSGSTLVDQPTVQHPANALAYAEAQPGASATIFQRTGEGVGIVHELARPNAVGQGGNFDLVRSAPMSEREFMARFATPSDTSGRDTTRRELRRDIRESQESLGDLADMALEDLPMTISGIERSLGSEYRLPNPADPRNRGKLSPRGLRKLHREIEKSDQAKGELKWLQHHYGQPMDWVRGILKGKTESVPKMVQVKHPETGEDTEYHDFDPDTAEPLFETKTTSSLYQQLASKEASATVPRPGDDPIFHAALNRKEEYTRTGTPEDWAHKASSSIRDAVRIASSPVLRAGDVTDRNHPLQRAMASMERRVQGVSGGDEIPLEHQIPEDLSDMSTEDAKAHARATVDRHAAYAYMLNAIPEAHRGDLAGELQDLGGATPAERTEEWKKTPEASGGATKIYTTNAPRHAQTDWRYPNRPDVVTGRSWLENVIKEHGSYEDAKAAAEEEEKARAIASDTPQGVEDEALPQALKAPEEVSHEGVAAAEAAERAAAAGEEAPEAEPEAVPESGLTESERAHMQGGGVVSPEAYERMTNADRDEYHATPSDDEDVNTAKLAQKVQRDAEVKARTRATVKAANVSTWHEEVRRRKAEIISKYAGAPQVPSTPGKTFEGMQQEAAAHRETVEGYLSGAHENRAAAIQAINAHNGLAAGINNILRSATTQGAAMRAAGHKTLDTLPDLEAPVTTPEEAAAAHEHKTNAAHAKLYSLLGDLVHAQGHEDVTKAMAGIAAHKKAAEEYLDPEMHAIKMNMAKTPEERQAQVAAHKAAGTEPRLLAAYGEAHPDEFPELHPAAAAIHQAAVQTRDEENALHFPGMSEAERKDAVNFRGPALDEHGVPIPGEKSAWVDTGTPGTPEPANPKILPPGESPMMATLAQGGRPTAGPQPGPPIPSTAQDQIDSLMAAAKMHMRDRDDLMAKGRMREASWSHENAHRAIREAAKIDPLIAGAQPFTVTSKDVRLSRQMRGAASAAPAKTVAPAPVVVSKPPADTTELDAVAGIVNKGDRSPYAVVNRLSLQSKLNAQFPFAPGEEHEETTPEPEAPKVAEAEPEAPKAGHTPLPVPAWAAPVKEFGPIRHATNLAGSPPTISELENRASPLAPELEQVRQGLGQAPQHPVSQAVQAVAAASPTRGVGVDVSGMTAVTRNAMRRNFGRRDVLGQVEGQARWGARLLQDAAATTPSSAAEPTQRAVENATGVTRASDRRARRQSMTLHPSVAPLQGAAWPARVSPESYGPDQAVSVRTPISRETHPDLYGG